MKKLCLIAALFALLVTNAYAKDCKDKQPFYQHCEEYSVLYDKDFAKATLICKEKADALCEDTEKKQSCKEQAPAMWKSHINFVFRLNILKQLEYITPEAEQKAFLNSYLEIALKNNCFALSDFNLSDEDIDKAMEDIHQ